MKFLSAIILCLWVSCLVHCSLERFGVLGGATCCAEHVCHEGEHDEEHEPVSDECQVCDYLENGATLAVKLGLEAQPEFALPVVMQLVLPVVDADSSAEVLLSVHGPPVRRLCEFLARTACPVRGPDCALI
ncbi:MAG: hypothetical protein JNJ83_19275 [Verrucomicrobiaceae bacterium]|nr:hypothetical protein [Verrucomicrobiaceae bacterium]